MADNDQATQLDPIPPLATSSARLSVPLDQNPAAIYLASLSEGSQRTMRTALNTIAGLLSIPVLRDTEGRDQRYLATPWADLRYQHTRAIQAYLQVHYAPATTNKLLAALRRVLREARRLGQISADDYDRATDLDSIQMEQPQLPQDRIIAEDELIALLRICADDPTPAGARDAAIIALLRGTGLRRAEMAGLDLGDYDAERGAVAVRTGKHRVVYTPPGVRATLNEWVALRGDDPGPLFYGLVKGGGLVRRRLAAQAMTIVCANRAAEAGIAPFTPQDMRRTFIGGLLEAGADMAVVQHLAGHADSATTSRYDRRSEDAKRRSVELVHVPHFPRAGSRAQ